MKEKISLKTTKVKWYWWIFSNEKKFDFRKGYLDIKKDDIVKFMESDEEGNLTGIGCFGRVNFVLHSRDFPKHFDWVGPEFTIFQFDIIVES